MSDERKGRIREMVAAKESNGDYNVLVGGQQAPLTQLTVGQVLKLQEAMKGKYKSTAVGKYQIKQSTLMSLVYKPGKEPGTLSSELRNPKDFNLDTPFDEVSQDWAADALLDRRGYNEFASGAKSTEEFALDLSKEWASLPNPSTGKSYYEGDGLNASHHRVSDVFGVLDAVEARPSGKL